MNGCQCESATTSCISGLQISRSGFLISHGGKNLTLRIYKRVGYTPLAWDTMSWLFRTGSCILLLVAVFLANYQDCDAGKTKRKLGKHSRTSKTQPIRPMKELLTRINQWKQSGSGKHTPKHFDGLFVVNLTDKLSAPRYMLNLYNNLKNHSVEDNSLTFNVTNITTTKPVKDADTIMAILNDCKCYKRLFKPRINTQ